MSCLQPAGGGLPLSSSRPFDIITVLSPLHPSLPPLASVTPPPIPPPSLHSNSHWRRHSDMYHGAGISHPKQGFVVRGLSSFSSQACCLHFHFKNNATEGRVTVAAHFCEYNFVNTFSQFRNERKKSCKLLLILHSLL